MKSISLIAWPLLLALGACAAFDGRGLEPNKSTAREVESLMGPPTEQVDAGPGGRTLYYSRQPFGRQTFAARIGPDQVFRALEPLLTPKNLERLRVNQTTKDEARQLLGPPYGVTRMPRQQYDAWEYWMTLDGTPYRLWLSFSDDAVLRDAYRFDETPREGGRLRR